MRGASTAILVMVAGAAVAAMPARIPAPADNPVTDAKVALGRRLFYDADLSDDGSMACATCHEQHRAFGDGNAVHPGVHGEAARRNVPGLANVAFFKSLTWGDPRIRTLEAQVAVPVLGDHPVEMGMKGREAEISDRLGKDDCYRQMFKHAFPENGGRIDMQGVARALASFERTLISRNAPYDRGPLADPQAREGARLFTRDCTQCHSGPNFTDGKFHRITAASPWDMGLSEISGKIEDAGKFRTPSLRNVAVTRPYFHDGSAESLEAAMERHAGRRTPAEIAALRAFLENLTDTDFLQDPRFKLPTKACGTGETK